MILPIYLFGSEVLRKKAEEVDFNNVEKEELKQFILDMQETMKKADGVGLAAPQVGKSIRVLIVDGSDIAETYDYLKGFKRVMINPVVLEESAEKVEYSEGCLSVPGIHCDIVRPKRIKISYYDENLVKKEEELDKFACRMVQHELDHLEGVIFVDKAAPVRKKMISGKLNNITKGKTDTSYKVKLDKK